MRFILVFSFMVFYISICSAQVVFQKTYGSSSDDWCLCIKQTFDGGYILAGHTFGLGAGSTDVYIIKTDSLGDTLWTRTYGGPDLDKAYDVLQLSDSGYIVVGSTRSFNFNPPMDDDDFYVLRINSYGDTLWTRHIGGSVSAPDIAYSVIQTGDGNFIIGGLTHSYGEGAYMIKLSSNGDSLLWAKSYLGIGFGAILQTNDSGYVVFYNSRFGDTLILIKANVFGDTLWTKEYSGGMASASDIRQTADGGFIMLAGSSRRLLIKVDALGDTTWTKEYYYSFGPSGASSIYQTSDMGYIAAGFMPGINGYVTKTDSMGNMEWVKDYGAWGSAGNDALSSITQTNDGGYLMAGGTDGFGAGGADFYLVKTDVLGNSGCNNANPGVTQSYPAIAVSRRGVLLSSGGLLGNTSTIVGSGGIVTTLCTNVGTEELQIEKEPISVYPNPTNGHFSITGVNVIDELKIINSLNQIIYHGNPHSKYFSFRVDVAGVYFVQATTNNKTVTRKFVCGQ